MRSATCGSRLCSRRSGCVHTCTRSPPSLTRAAGSQRASASRSLAKCGSLGGARRLAGARPAEAAGAPIAAALIDTMAKFALPVSVFDDLLQALTFDVYDDAMESLEALEAYGIATAGALTALRARVLAEGRETGAQGASDAAGAGLALARAVLDFALGRRRPMLAPRALIERHGVSLAGARAGGGGAGLRAALAELADAAEARFDEAEARLAALPAALAPAFAPLATARLDLKRWRRAGEAAPFAPAAPWRRQWALWLWARRR